MIQSKDAYYIDIPKTASTFLESCLHLVCKENTLMYHTSVEHKNNNLVFNLTTKKYVMDTCADEDSNFIQSAKHGCLDYDVETHKNKLIFATIKNPWEYYVSKFTFRNIINPRNATNPWIESAKNRYSNFENTFDWAIKNVFINTTQQTLTNQIMHKTKKNYLPIDDIEIETWFNATYFNNPLMKIIGITDNLGKEFINLVLNNKDKFDLNEEYEKELYKIAINDKYFASPIYAKFSNPNRVQNLDYKSFYTPELINLVYEKDKILIDHYNLKPNW